MIRVGVTKGAGLSRRAPFDCTVYWKELFTPEETVGIEIGIGLFKVLNIVHCLTL